MLRAIADGTGPDIFMLPKNEYAPLESQIAKIPESAVSIADFERRFDAVFAGLVTSEKGENNATTQSLLGVPLGYETLGVFYNRSLFRSGIPTNWSQVEALYGQFPNGIFPTNLGLKKNFVPNISDILPFFLSESKISSYKNLRNITTPFQKYYSFGDLINTPPSEENTENAYSQNDTLRRTEGLMKENKNSTTLDEFMRGNIGMIVGYPSLISDLELSAKRVGATGMENIIYTDRIPQFSASNPTNIAKYNFFAISKNSQNDDIALQFLNYLMSAEAGQIAVNLYPTKIPAQIEFHATAANATLSSNFPKARMDAFLLAPTWSVNVFDYGSKNTFDAIIDSNWDNFSSISTLSALGEELSRTISCEVEENSELCKTK